MPPLQLQAHGVSPIAIAVAPRSFDTDDDSLPPENAADPKDTQGVLVATHSNSNTRAFMTM